MRLQVYPNREFVFSCQPPRAPRLSDANEIARERRARRPLKRGDGSPLPLVTTPRLSQAGRRRRSGLGPISPVARARIRQIGGAIPDAGRGRQVFVTGTLPGSTHEAMVAFSRLAGYAIKLIQTYLPRQLGLSAKQIDYLWVWEHQKRGALHLHAVFCLPGEDLALRLVDVWRSIWIAVLRACDAKAGGVDIFARRGFGGTWKDDESAWRIDAQIVKVSASRYLAKYQSKGSQGAGEFRPGRWYGASRSLRASCMSITLSLSCRDQSCPKDSQSVTEIRRVANLVLTAALGWGEVRPTRADTSWGVGLMGFLSDDVSPASILGILRESLRDELVDVAIMPNIDAGSERRQSGQVNRLLSAYYRSPVWFRVAVEANLPPDLRGRDSLYGIGWSEAFDLKLTIADQMYAVGCVGDVVGRHAWAKRLSEARLVEDEEL